MARKFPTLEKKYDWYSGFGDYHAHQKYYFTFM